MVGPEANWVPGFCRAVPYWSGRVGFFLMNLLGKSRGPKKLEEPSKNQSENASNSNPTISNEKKNHCKNWKIEGPLG
jgi:hypothetical protein